MALTAGTRLGPYEILAPLGAGGMGEVYRTRDTRLNRDVALKILPDTFTHDPERVARFRREAHVLAALNHPHIAAIYGLDEAGGHQFLVLELVDGESLDKRIARGPIPVDEALETARQIAEALEAAHDKGIIHRDLKPANIALTGDGQVKVLDFGLAKTAEAMSGSTSLPSSPTITSPTLMSDVGVILGTAGYMSPEQARGLTSDKRSDVWAFGCVLYEMLTGKRAFAGEDVSDTLAAVLRAEADWTALPKGLSAATRLLLERCLEKDRKKRIGDMSTALFLMNESIAALPAIAPVHPMTPVWRRALPYLAAAFVVGGVVAAVAWIVRTSSNPPVVSRFTVPLPEGQTFTNTGRHVVAISPDGTRMVYVANGALHLRSLSGLAISQIPGTESRQGALSPVFSPDSQSVVFWLADERVIRKMSLAGGAAVTLAEAVRPTGISWDATGVLFGQGGRGIMRVPANGGKVETLVSVQDGETAHGPQMLPDGRSVLFTVATGTSADRWDKAKVVVQAIDSVERKTLVAGGSDGRYLSTGHLVYALEGTLFAVPFDVRRLEPTGDAFPILEGVRRGTSPEVNPGVAQFSVAGNGTLIYVPGPVSRSAERTLARLDPKSGLELLKLAGGHYEAPRVSPDGKRLAFGTEDGKEASVWIYDLSGTSAMRKLTMAGRNRFPLWSADGERVVYQSDREGDHGLFWQRADGTGPAERLTRAERDTAHFPESWAPDGERLLYSASQRSSVSLWVLRLQDRKAEPFGAIQSSSPVLPRAAFSPDGRWVAYGSNETGPQSIYLQPFPATGAKYAITTGSSHSPMWLANGKALLYVDFDNRPAGRLIVMSLTTAPTVSFGNPMPLPHGPLQINEGLGLNAPRRFDIAPDGKIIGTVESEDAFSAAADAQRIEVVLHWFEELKARVPSR